MKRNLVLILLALVASAGTARATPTAVGAGIFLGVSNPLLQDVSISSFSPSDAIGEGGTMYGLRVPVTAIPVFTFEPYYAKASYGDRTETFNGLSYTRAGYDLKSYGINALLGRPSGTGVHFFPYVGLSKTKLERPGEEIKKGGYNFGLGLGIGAAPKVSIQIRTEFAMVKTGDTSRKFGSANVGLNYNLLP
jgi:hypothetical protein